MDIEAEAMDHLRHLCQGIGPRLIGTPSNLAAADYIEDIFQAAGLATERQPFPCPAWEVTETELSLSGERLAAAANTFSPGCDVKAPLVALGTLAELEAAELNNRIGLLYGDLTKEALSHQGNPVYIPEHHLKILRLLLEKQPAALITLNPYPDSQWPIIEDWQLPIPSVTVTAATGLKLLQDPDQAAHLRINARLSEGRSYNVVGRKSNRNRPRLVLCTHYDTKPDTPGAIDNGSGTAVLLVLATLMAPTDLTIGLEFVAFSGEEYGLGGDTYLRRHGLEPVRFGQPAEEVETAGFDDILAAINIDGVGQQAGVNSVATLAASAAFQSLVADVQSDYPAMVTIPPWPASNHYDFYTHGVPSVAISSTGVANVIHRPIDTVEWISSGRLAEVITFVKKLVGRLQDKPFAWARER